MLTLLPDLCNFSSLRTYIDISELTIGIFQFLFHLPCEVYLLPSARSIVYTSARTERSICPTNYKEKEMYNRIYKCIFYFYWNFYLLITNYSIRKLQYYFIRIIIIFLRWVSKTSLFLMHIILFNINVSNINELKYTVGFSIVKRIEYQPRSTIEKYTPVTTSISYFLV